MREGHYTNVHCHSITGSGGRLSNGTGTYTDSTRTFACGPFPAGDRPKIGDHYNLNGEHGGHRYEFPNWVCAHSGETSDFKEK